MGKRKRSRLNFAIILCLLSQVFAVAVFPKSKIELPSNERWGYIDKSGKMVIAPTYLSAGNFTAGKASVKISDLSAVLIDKVGRPLLNTAFAPWSSMELHDGLRVVTGPTKSIKSGNFLRLNNYSFLTCDGKLWTAQYANCTNFSEGFALVLPLNSGDHYVVVDKKEHIVLALNELQASFEFSEGVLPACSNGKYGFLDNSKKWRIAPKFEEAHAFKEGLAAVRQTTSSIAKWGFIDHSGKLVIPYKYSIVEDFHEGLAKFYGGAEGGMGFIDKTGKVVIPYNKDRFYGDLSEGLISFKEKYGCGFLSKDGKVAIKPQYTSDSSFSEGLCAVALGSEQNLRWGFIDRSGKWIIKPAYKLAGKFSEGLAPVLVDLNEFQKRPSSLK